MNTIQYINDPKMPPNEPPIEHQSLMDWTLRLLKKAETSAEKTVMVDWQINNQTSTFRLLHIIEMFFTEHPQFAIEKIVVIRTNQPEALHALNHNKIPEKEKHEN